MPSPSAARASCSASPLARVSSAACRNAARAVGRSPAATAASPRRSSSSPCPSGQSCPEATRSTACPSHEAASSCACRAALCSAARSTTSTTPLAVAGGGPAQRVVRDLRQPRVAVQLLHRPGQRAVQRGATRQRQPCVQRLPDQGVHEADRPCAGLDHQPGGPRLVERREDVVGAAAGGAGEDLRVDLLAGCGGGGQDVLRRGREPPDPARDDVADAGGDRVGRSEQVPLLVQQADQLAQEERVAPAAAVQQRDAVRQVGPADPPEQRPRRPGG